MNAFSIVSCEPDELRALISLLQERYTPNLRPLTIQETLATLVSSDARPNERDNVDLELFDFAADLFFAPAGPLLQTAEQLSEVCSAVSG